MRKVIKVQNKLKHRKINFEKKVEIRMSYREKSKSKKEKVKNIDMKWRVKSMNNDKKLNK